MSYTNVLQLLGRTDNLGNGGDLRKFVLPEKSDPEKSYLSAQGLKLQKRGQHNSVLQTRQSLGSSDFRLVFKNHLDANQGKHRIAF